MDQKAVFVLGLCLCLQVASGWFLTKKKEVKEATEAVSDECLQMAARGDCQFYSCFDQRFPCNHNYARKYGLDFCKKFKSRIQTFTPVAQRWINNTRTCAIRRIAEFYKNNEIECYDFHHRAEHIYSDCSRTNGVCSASMMWSNRVALKDVYLQDFSHRSLKRVYMMFKDCGRLQVARVMFWILAKLGGGGETHGK